MSSSQATASSSRQVPIPPPPPLTETDQPNDPYARLSFAPASQAQIRKPSLTQMQDLNTESHVFSPRISTRQLSDISPDGAQLRADSIRCGSAES